MRGREVQDRSCVYSLSSQEADEWRLMEYYTQKKARMIVDNAKFAVNVKKTPQEINHGCLTLNFEKYPLEKQSTTLLLDGEIDSKQQVSVQ